MALHGISTDDDDDDDPAYEPLDAARLAAVFPLRLEQHARIDSTQSRAIALARQNGPLDVPVLIVAGEQTAGRGRGGNAWWTAPGSLAFSLLFDPATWGLPPGVQPLRSLAVGVALVDALTSWLAEGALGLRWPNDVFAGGRKLAGILLDVLPGERHVLGVGINVNNAVAAAPADVRARAVSLCELAGRPIELTGVLAAVLEHLAATMIRLAAAPQEVGRRFDQLCRQKGALLTIDVGQTQTTGRCIGIAADGALVLETPAGQQRIYSGTLRHDCSGPAV